MASLARWDPFRDLLNLQNEMTRLFSRTASGGDDWTAAWGPPIDVREDQDRFVAYVEIPGLRPDQVDVTVNDGTLTIRGERKFYEEASEESFHRVERRFGAFSRSMTLPSAVDADGITATFENGLLRIEIPKSDRAKPRRIEVKASS